jgi:hypothetical protein
MIYRCVEQGEEDTHYQGSEDTHYQGSEDGGEGNRTMVIYIHLIINLY